MKSEPPPQGHGNPLIEIGLIAGSVALLVVIAIPTVRDIWYTHDVPEEEKAGRTSLGRQPSNRAALRPKTGITVTFRPIHKNAFDIKTVV